MMNDEDSENAGDVTPEASLYSSFIIPQWLRPRSSFGGTALRFDPLWFSSQGRPAAGQPWAGGRNPVGI